MFPHHEAAIDAVTRKLEGDPEVLALLIGGSVAHGFATETSDIDIMLIVSPEAHAARVARHDFLYFERDSTPYEGGYVDGKYMTLDFIRDVAERGSEPARFAFKDAIVAFSRIDGVREAVERAAAYPVAGRAERMRSFYAQLQAWHWFCQEAIRHRNDYLLTVAVANLSLYAGRLVLAENELLYPYHKWMLAVLERAERKPDGLMELIHRVIARRDAESVEALYRAVDGFAAWSDEPAEAWGKRFMLDTELTWQDGRTPVADL